MKVTCQRSELLTGIQTVQAVVATRSTLPVLSNILLETEPDTLRLAASDLEMAIRCEVHAKVEKSGAITLPAKLLADIVRDLDEDEVEIFATKENNAQIKCRKA